MLTPEELAEKGERAKQALPYLTELVAAARAILLDNLISLAPDETYKFSYHKAQMYGLEDLMSLAMSDINSGEKAIDVIQGNSSQKGGIL